MKMIPTGLPDVSAKRFPMALANPVASVHSQANLFFGVRETQTLYL